MLCWKGVSLNFFSFQKLVKNIYYQNLFLFNVKSICYTLKTSTYQVAVGGIVEETSEGDDRGENGEVDEEEAGHALDVQRVLVVAPVERRFPLDVLNEPAEQSFWDYSLKAWFFFVENKSCNIVCEKGLVIMIFVCKSLI